MISHLQCHVAPTVHTKLMPLTCKIRRP